MESLLTSSRNQNLSMVHSHYILIKLEYGNSKIQAEKLIKQMCEMSNMEYIILRPTGNQEPKASSP